MQALISFLYNTLNITGLTVAVFIGILIFMEAIDGVLRLVMYFFG